jgi:hypothetical protein
MIFLIIANILMVFVIGFFILIQNTDEECLFNIQS